MEILGKPNVALVRFRVDKIVYSEVCSKEPSAEIWEYVPGEYIKVPIHPDLIENFYIGDVVEILAAWNPEYTVAFHAFVVTVKSENTTYLLYCENKIWNQIHLLLTLWL